VHGPVPPKNPIGVALQRLTSRAVSRHAMPHEQENTHPVAHSADTLHQSGCPGIIIEERAEKAKA